MVDAAERSAFSFALIAVALLLQFAVILSIVEHGITEVDINGCKWWKKREVSVLVGCDEQSVNETPVEVEKDRN